MIEPILKFEIDCDECHTYRAVEYPLGDAIRPDVVMFQNRAYKEFEEDGWAFVDNKPICEDCGLAAVRSKKRAEEVAQ